MKTNFDILIIGGGTGGIMTAAQLLRKDKNLSVAIIEPSEKHYYQPAWTLVGADAYDFDEIVRDEASVIPKGTEWIKDFAETFDPENNAVTTRNSGTFYYRFLIVAPGIQLDIDALPGLREALDTPYVCSNYIDPLKTKKVLQEFKGGNAVFTQPSTPIKCGGAPQKIMYLADEFFRKNGTRNKTNIIYATPGSVIFGVKEFADTLTEIVRKKGIILKTFYNPVRIDAENKHIYFKYSKPGENACIVTEDNLIQEIITGEAEIKVPYDMLHLAPPQSAPDFIKKSPLAHAEGPSKGWLNVNIHTLQHHVYPNVFGLGDAAALPTAKTGAAIRKQAPVVVDNILTMIKSEKIGNKTYSGYSSCPLITGYGKMVLAEFKYDNVRDSDPIISKLMDTTKEQYSMWLLKKYGLPYLYWNQMLKGKM
jgi:sulfide:quinone oxidoreductase